MNELKGDCKMEENKRSIRKTSRDLQAIERRNQLLKAAKDLFAEKGYHATSMRAINQKAGVAEGLTYHYFPKGKLEILHTIVREGKEQKSKKIEKLIHSFGDDMSMREVLLLFANRISEIFIEDPLLMQIVFREKNLLDEEQSQFLSDATKQNRKSIVAFLAKRAAQGEIRQMDFELAAIQFMSNILFVVFQRLLGTKVSKKDIESYIEKMVDFTLGLWSK